MEKFTAYSFNESKKEITLEGIVLSKEKSGLDFGVNIALENDIALFFDNITGMILYGTPCTKKQFEDMSIVKILSDKVISTAISSTHNMYLSEGIRLSNTKEKITMTFMKQNIVSAAPNVTKIHKFMNNFNLYAYFKNASYMQNYGNSFLNPNTVYVNPVGFVLPSARNEETIDLGTKDIINLMDIPHMACLGIEDAMRKNFTDMIYNFNIKKFKIAKYIPETNILILSNVLHCDEWDWMERFFLYLVQYLKKRNKTDTGITLGCDPEFELYDSSGAFMDKRHTENDGRLQRKIGGDGHGDTLELRPEPSEDPADIVADLVDLFNSLSHLRVSVKGDKEALGGHIHFGAPHGKALKPTKPLLDLFDLFIGNHFKETSGSARTDYGRKGDNRIQPWGFEYRTPPASVFATKEIAYITMKLAKNLLEALNKESIAVTIPLEEKDYYKFLTEEEAKYYFNFPKLYKKLNTSNIIEYWTRVKESPINVKVYGKWEDKIKSYFVSNLKDTICDLPTTICLYDTEAQFAGLNSGNQIPHVDEVHCDEGIAIGIPEFIRKGSLRDAMDVILLIKQKIIRIMGTKMKRTTEILFPEEMIGSRYKTKPKVKKGIVWTTDINPVPVNNIFIDDLDDEEVVF